MPAFGGFAETVEHDITGLVFAPNDVHAPLQQLLELAASHRFPQHVLDPAHVAQVQQRFCRARHVTRVRAIMNEAVN